MWRAIATGCLVMAASGAQAEDKQVYLGTLPGYPPFTFYEDGADKEVEEIVEPGEESDHFTGYSWEIAREAFHAVGWTVKLRITPWARGMYELKQKDTDILFPTGKNPTRLEYMQYSEGSVVDVDFLIYKRAGESIGYEGLRSLEDKRIAVLRDFNYGNDFNEADHFEKVSVDSIKQGFDMVAEGRVDGFAGYDVPWDYKLRKWNRSDEFEKLPPFDGTREFLAGLQGYAPASRAIDAFDRGLEKIKANGTLAEIRERWE